MSKVWQNGELITATDLNRMEQSLTSESGVYIIDGSHLERYILVNSSGYKYTGYINETPEEIDSLINDGKLIMIDVSPRVEEFNNNNSLNDKVTYSFLPMILSTKQNNVLVSEVNYDVVNFTSLYAESDHSCQLTLVHSLTDQVDHYHGVSELNDLVNDDYTIVDQSVPVTFSSQEYLDYFENDGNLVINVDGHFLIYDQSRSHDEFSYYNNYSTTGDLAYEVEYNSNTHECNFCVYDLSADVAPGTYHVKISGVDDLEA